ncbi:MAG: metallophosphoesterase [Tissierellia bacterium]|nr:metallophosphoesterase [Tissierellia bacterium]
MKILFFTDTHIRGTSPQNRLDDFTLTLEKKLIEIGEIVKKNDVDYVIHGGDIFDRPDISPSVVKKYIPIFLGFGKPIYFIAGNHDVYGYNLNTLNRTLLGLLTEFGLFKELNNKPIIWEKNGKKVQITGESYNYLIDKEKNREAYILRNRLEEADFAIHVAHGFLTDLKLSPLIPHTPIDEVLETKADLTLSGHYHTGYGLIEKNGKLFLNPGGVVRISNHQSEVDRLPRVAIITIKESIYIDFIYLKSAKPGTEVLSKSDLDHKSIRAGYYGEFQASLDRAIDFKQLNIFAIIDDLVKADNIDETIKEEAIKRIVRAEMEMKRDDLD